MQHDAKTKPLPHSVKILLQQAAGAGNWRDQASDLIPYNQEWRGYFQGHSPLVLLPRDTEIGGAIGKKFAPSIGCPIVPQGGNTGLVGGAVAGANEVILSLSHMTSLRQIDAKAGHMVVVEAGCSLADAHAHAAYHNMLFPLHLASQSRCQIGGNLATNAGGMAVLKYGTMRDLTLGLEIVLPDGAIVSQLSGLRKDNTGYDLRHIFIGAEGTLGIITAACLRLFPRDKTTVCGMGWFCRSRKSFGFIGGVAAKIGRRAGGV